MFNRPSTPPLVKSDEAYTQLADSYTQRAELHTNTVAKRLLRLMDFRKTNLCVAADVKTKAELLALADAVGPHICLLKTHIDILVDFDADTIVQLKSLAKKHGFLIFEDRKFADIGNTVVDQYKEGIYHIAEWAHIINAHSVPGPTIISSLKEASFNEADGTYNSGLLMLAEMSSEGNLAVGDYTKDTIDMAEKNPAYVIGYITKRILSENKAFINCRPGIQFNSTGDGKGQTYTPPEEAFQTGTDIQIVGRGIYAAKPDEKLMQAATSDDEIKALIKDAQVKAAKSYREAGWNAYISRISLEKVNRSTKGLSMSSTPS
ncbi:MAG: orotidine-5'-phosphate decarboxylase [Pseudomonadota bacterium]